MLLIGENPLEVVQLLIWGGVRLRRGCRLYPVLHHQLHLFRTCLRGCLSRRPVQHRRRGPGLSRRPGGRNSLPLSRLSSAAAADPACDRRLRPVRRGLGVRAGLAAGLPGQPHRHYDHHVQLHRRLGDGLSPGQCHGASRIHAAGIADIRRKPPVCRSFTRLRARSGSNSPARPSICLFLWALVCCVLVWLSDLAHAARLRPAHGGHQTAGRGLCRYVAQVP